MRLQAERVARGAHAKRSGTSKAAGYLRADALLFSLYFERKSLRLTSAYVITHLKRNGSYVKGSACGEACFSVRT